MAERVMAENLGRGLSRMGESHVKGLGYLSDAADGAALTTAYREARVAILHQAGIEKAVVRSARVLWTDTTAGARRIAAVAPLIDHRANALLAETRAAYQLQAAQRGVVAAEPVVSPAERATADLMIELALDELSPAAPGASACAVRSTPAIGVTAAGLSVRPPALVSPDASASYSNSIMAEPPMGGGAERTV